MTEQAKNPPQELKRGHFFYALTARLKSCPSQNTLDPGASSFAFFAKELALIGRRRVGFHGPVPVMPRGLKPDFFFALNAALKRRSSTALRGSISHGPKFQRDESWNPTSRKRRETWGTRVRGGVGEKQVPRLREIIRFADNLSLLGMTKYFGSRGLPELASDWRKRGGLPGSGRRGQS
jgi:hypothetical protein